MAKPHYKEFSDGVAVRGSVQSISFRFLVELLGGFATIVEADPPYGQIVKKSWDRKSEREVLKCYSDATELAFNVLDENGTYALWWGTGKPGCRPGYIFAGTAEYKFGIEAIDPITWKKKRGFGRPDRLLYAREELTIYKRRGETHTFNVPYSDIERGYAGFNLKYPAKSKFKRLTNVWDHVSDMLKKSTKNPCEKPVRIYKDIFTTYSDGGPVLSLFAGSGSACVAARELGRRWVAVEDGEREFEELVERMKDGPKIGEPAKAA